MIPIARPTIGVEEINAVCDVLKSGNVAQGQKVKELEESFAKFIGANHAVAVNSGTAALHCSLYSTGVKQGDEVITVPFTFIATANSIMMQGAKPVFVDIEDETFNIDAKKIEEKITKRTKAIIAVDLYGNPYEYGDVHEISLKHGIKIIEDACQAVGAEYRGKKCGTLGDISCFSFYATKNMITAEGGMIATDNPDYANNVKMFRNHGQSEKTRYDYVDIGYNYRMTDVLAAIGIEQLKKLSKFTEARIQNAEYLTKTLTKIKGISVPVVKNRNRHVFHQYTIKVEEDFRLTRDELIEYLNKKGVGCSVHYPKPLHLYNHIKKFGYKIGDFPVAEKLVKQVISLPVHPNLTIKQLDYIIDVFKGLE